MSDLPSGVSTVAGGPAAAGLPQEIVREVVIDGVRVQAHYKLWWTRKLGPAEDAA